MQNRSNLFPGFGRCTAPARSEELLRKPFFDREGSGIDGEPAGMGIRESKGLITHNTTASYCTYLVRWVRGQLIHRRYLHLQPLCRNPLHIQIRPHRRELRNLRPAALVIDRLKHKAWIQILRHLCSRR